MIKLNISPSFAATITEGPSGMFYLGNQKIERVIQARQGNSFKTFQLTNRLSEENVVPGDEEFALITSAGDISSRDFKVASVDSETHDGIVALTIELETSDWQASVRYELAGDQPFDTRHLTLKYRGTTPTQLLRVWDGSFELPGVGQIIKTHNENTDLAAFARLERGGFMFNLDFPYSEIQIQDQRIRLGYVLEDAVESGYTHKAEAINVGTYLLSGELISTGGGLTINFDRPEGSWATEVEESESKIDHHSPDREEIEVFRALYVALLPDRMKQPFHFLQSYDDLDPRREQGSIMDRPESVERELQLCSDWGFNVYLMYEDHAVFLPNRPGLGVVEKISADARKRNLYFGSLTPCNLAEGFFWKSEATSWPDPNWKYLYQDGKREERAGCWAAPGFVDYMLERDTPWIKQHNWSVWGLDFFIVNACFDKAHQHPLGRDSFYKQMKGAERYHQGLKEASQDPDQFIILTWLGYESWLPKIGKMADFFYMADPANLWPMPAINMNDQLQAGYRRMFHRLVKQQGITGRLLQNPIFLANWRDGLIPDSKAYQRQFVSLFAFSPNVNVQQPWRFLERLTVAEHAEAYAFFAKWFQYAKDNYETLCNLILLSPSPAPGVLEAYAHPSTQGDKSIMVVINPNFFSMPLEFTIGKSIGLEQSGKAWMIQEKFPNDQWALIDGKTRWDWNDSIKLQVPPKSTLLFEVVQATPVAEGEVRWYGYNPKARGRQNGSIWTFEGEAASSFPVALETVAGSHIDTILARNPEPHDDLAPLDVHYEDGLAYFDLKFPAYIFPTPAQPELADWVVKPGNLEEGTQQGWINGIEGKPTRFPLPSVLNAENPDLLMVAPEAIRFEGKNIGKFMGSHVYNIWTWDMPLDLQFSVKQGIPQAVSKPESTKQPKPGDEPLLTEFPDSDSYWLSTTLAPLAVPTRWMGYTPYFDQHMFIPLPFIDYERIEEIKAWVNGRSAIVEAIDYPLVPPYQQYHTPGTHKFLYYLDGSKNNLVSNIYETKPNVITLWVKWKP